MATVSKMSNVDALSPNLYRSARGQKSLKLKKQLTLAISVGFAKLLERHMILEHGWNVFTMILKRLAPKRDPETHNKKSASLLLLPRYVSLKAKCDHQHCEHNLQIRKLMQNVVHNRQKKLFQSVAISMVSFILIIPFPSPTLKI
jgi:hypothetical protein